MSANGTGEERGGGGRRDELGAAGLLFVDVKIRSALITEGRRRAIVRLFGIPRGDQSWLATTILIAAGAMVARDAVPVRWRRPSGGDVTIGGALVNVMGRGLAGAPSSAMPLAGGVIVIALLARGFRPAMADSARDVAALGHKVGSAFGTRYMHHGDAAEHGRRGSVETG
jgi:hypothetical protein